MPTTTSPYSLPRLLTLIALLSGLLVWGVADRLAKDTDRHFQVAGVEEHLSLSSGVDDTSSDPDLIYLHEQPLPAPAITGQPMASAGSHNSGARLLSDPGLPRAPPA